MNQMHFEEHHTLSVSSLKLLMFFKKYFSAYRITMALSILLAAFAIGSDLALPQLVKIALDSHISASAQKIAPDPAGSPGSENILSTIKDLIIPSPEKNVFFILNQNLPQIPEKTLQQLKTAGRMSGDKYYYTRQTDDVVKVALDHPDIFYMSKYRVFISYDHLATLTAAELRIIRDNDFKGILKITLYFIAIILTSLIFTFFQIFIVEYACQKIMHEIRMDIFCHIQSRSQKFFSTTPVGRLVTRATNDVQNLHEMFNALFANILKDILLIIGITGLLFWINVKLAVVCFSVLPLLLMASVFFSIHSRNAFRQVRIKIAAINAAIQENITGIEVVKAFCREQLNTSKFIKLNRENYTANMKQTLIFAIFNPVVDGTRLGVIALIIWYGGGLAVQEAISIGTLVIFLYYMRMFFRPIQDLAEKYNIIQSAFASLERIYLLLNNEDHISDPELPQNLLQNQGKINFNNVSFRYNAGEPVLENISFNVEPGQTVAIVGLTGSGKSTLINLLERFYDPDNGEILIDETNIRDIPKKILRNRIGLVLQDIFLFAGTVRSNLTLGKNNYSDAEIYSALKTANADQLVSRLPKGLDEDITEGGKTLSTGERQLLAFARAILINPKILVLDEATAYIDPITENLIQNALKRITHKRTSLIIAHRLSTIQNADRILVLHKGTIHESGTHEELLKRKGLYFKLSSLQNIQNHSA